MDNYLAFLFNLDKSQLLQEMCYRRFQLYERILLLQMSVSVILIVLEENFFFEDNFEASLINPHDLMTDISATEPNSSKILRTINLILMLSMVLALYLRKNAYFVFMKATTNVQFSQYFVNSQYFFELCFEIGVNCIQTYPDMQGWYSSTQRQWNVVYFDDTILTFLAVIIRISFIIRGCLYMTKFSSPKSMKICFDYGVSAGVFFSLKSEFHHHLKLFVSCFLALSMLTNGVLLRLCERSAELYSGLNWDYIWNSFWCVIVTMTTVGYGDFVPTTDNGRVVVGFTAVLGSLVTSMICIVFLIEFTFNCGQEKAYERIMAAECTIKLNESACKCISLAIRHYLKIKKASESEKVNLWDEFLVDIKKKVKDFRTWKKIIIEFKHNKKIERRLGTVHQDFNQHLDELGVLMTYYGFVKTKLERARKNQKQLDKNFKLIESFHENLILNCDRFSKDNLKEFQKSITSPTKKLGSLKKDNIIGICENMKIPFIELPASNNTNCNFTTYSKSKSRSSLLKTSSETKIRNITKNLERQVSIKKPRKSIMMINPILEIDEDQHKDEGGLKMKRLSIISKKRLSIRQKDKINLSLKSKDSIGGNQNLEKSPSFMSLKSDYPSFENVNNLSLNYNYLNDSENIPGNRMDEIAEQEEKEEELFTKKKENLHEEEKKN